MGQIASLLLNYGDPGDQGARAGKNPGLYQEHNLKNRWGLILRLRSLAVLPSMLRQLKMLIPKLSIASMCLAPWPRIPLKRLYFNLHIHLIPPFLDITLRVTRHRDSTIHRRLQTMHPLEVILHKAMVIHPMLAIHLIRDMYRRHLTRQWFLLIQVTM